MIVMMGNWLHSGIFEESIKIYLHYSIKEICSKARRIPLNKQDYF
jgi:hypothetical protein